MVVRILTNSATQTVRDSGAIMTSPFTRRNWLTACLAASLSPTLSADDGTVKVVSDDEAIPRPLNLRPFLPRN